MGTPVQQLFDLSGQTALVTGGSRGLGLQMAEALGVFVQRQGGGFGWALIGIGGGVAAIGAVLIFVRSRRGPDR